MLIISAVRRTQEVVWHPLALPLHPSVWISHAVKPAFYFTISTLFQIAVLVVNPCIVSEWSSVRLLGRPAVWNSALDTRKEKAAEPSRKGWEAAIAGCIFSSLLQCRWWRRESLVVCHKNAPEKVSTSVYQLMPCFTLFLTISFMHTVIFFTFK